MLTRSKAIAASMEQSQYNLRPRSAQNLRESPEPTEIDSLITELSQLSNNKVIILTQKMRNELQKHEFKKFLVACSLPLPNEKETEMKSSEKEEKFVPEYVVDMVWSNKEVIISEDAKLFVNEIFDLSKTLFNELDKKVTKLPYFDDYFKYVTMSTIEYIDETFDVPIVGCIVELFEDENRPVPDTYKYFYINDVINAFGLKNALCNSMCIRGDHIDGGVLKNGGNIDEAIKGAVDAGVYGGDVTPNQVLSVFATGRDKKEAALTFSMKKWQERALKAEESIKKKNNGINLAVTSFWNRFGNILKGYLNAPHLKPYLQRVKGPTFVSGIIFYGRGGVKQRAHEAGIEFTETDFTRAGVKYKKYGSNNIDQQTISNFLGDKSNCIKKKGAHIGWNFFFQQMDLKWDNQRCLLDVHVRVGARDANGREHRT